MSDLLNNLLTCSVDLILTLATLMLVTAWDFQPIDLAMLFII